VRDFVLPPGLRVSWQWGLTGTEWWRGSGEERILEKELVLDTILDTYFVSKQDGQRYVIFYTQVLCLMSCTISD